MRHLGVLAGALFLPVAAAVLLAASFLAGHLPAAGYGAWFAATQIVWIFGATAMLVVPLLILRRRLTAAWARRPASARS